MIQVGITLGDPWGIGPELISKSLVQAFPKDEDSDVEVVVFAPQDLLRELAAQQNTQAYWSQLQDELQDQLQTQARLSFVWHDKLANLAQASDENSRAWWALSSFNQAIDWALAAPKRSLLTSPVDKRVMRKANPGFVGHTEHLRNRCEVPRTLMLLDNGRFRVLPLTGHMRLKEVASSLTTSGIEQAVELLASEFQKWITPKWPLRFGLCGLNPHAGEMEVGTEEINILLPALQTLRAKGYHIEGPLSADGAFAQAAGYRWDVMITCYHDQGLIPIKVFGLDEVCNITLGLPFFRVSPGHGVAYDLVGRNQAKPQSFIKALKLATAASKTKKGSL